MYITPIHRVRLVAGLFVLPFLLAPALKASLLTSANEAQLETWLGRGNLDFTNIFTKTPYSNASAFHAAVDGQGETFVLMLISGNGGFGTSSDRPIQIVGGYNPQSWSSSNSYNVTPNDADRTAFLYNLTYAADGNPGTRIQRQNLSGQGAGDAGRYQTYNSQYYGPAFGSGPDLYVDSTLWSGGASNYSYGGTTFFGDDIVSGGPNYSSFSTFNVGTLEVYTFAPAQGGGSVPDATGTLGLMGLSLLGLMAIRRRLA